VLTAWAAGSPVLRRVYRRAAAAAAVQVQKRPCWPRADFPLHDPPLPAAGFVIAPRCVDVAPYEPFPDVPLPPCFTTGSRDILPIDFEPLLILAMIRSYLLTIVVLDFGKLIPLDLGMECPLEPRRTVPLFGIFGLNIFVAIIASQRDLT
jgi:hypothetical protein